MKRLTLVVFLMFVMMFGVMGGQVWGQDDIEYHLNRSKALYDKNDYFEAINEANIVLKLNPNSVDAYYYRGIASDRVYYNKDRDATAEALSDYNMVIKLNKNYNSDVYLKRGDIYLIYERFRDYNKALSDFNTAIKLDPKNWLAYYSRGRLYRDMKKWDEAIADYFAALINIDLKWINPNDKGRGYYEEISGALKFAIYYKRMSK